MHRPLVGHHVPSACRAPCTHGRRLVGAGRRPGSQLGVVGRRGSPAYEDRVHAATELMDHLPRRRVGDPAAIAAAGSNLSIERHGPLGHYPGPARGKEFQIRGVELSGLVFQDARLHFHAGGAEFRQTAAGNLGKRVGHGGHHAGDTGRKHGAGARRCLALVAAWLQRHVERRSAGPRSGNVQGFNLGVGLAEAAMPAFAHDLRAARDHAAHHRVRLDETLPLGGQFQGPLHVPRSRKAWSIEVLTSRASRACRRNRRIRCRGSRASRARQPAGQPRLRPGGPARRQAFHRDSTARR